MHMASSSAAFLILKGFLAIPRADTKVLARKP